MSKLRAYAPAWVKRMVWDRKHLSTRIDPEGCPHDLLECLRTLDSNAGIADFGCGAGNLRAALRSRGWKGHYVGVDTSERAIEVARKSEDSNAEWHVSTTEDFPILTQKVSTICFCESIYYIQTKSVPTVLARCHQSLSPGGRIVIRIYHTDRHREYIALLVGLGAQCKPPIYSLTKE